MHNDVRHDKNANLNIGFMNNTYIYKIKTTTIHCNFEDLQLHLIDHNIIIILIIASICICIYAW